NWVYAHPVLLRYGFTAILFTITGLIGNGPARAYAGQGASVRLCPDHHEARTLMFSDQPDQGMLRLAEIEQMVGAKTFEIHSHTHTHTRWDKTCPTAEQKKELFANDLSLSKDTLVQRLGQASPHLCWPQGYFDDDYLDAARQLGFRYFYTTDARGQNTPNGNPEYVYRFA